MDAHTCDAIVIGAGHNGLVAANLLADAGWQVTVLEATEHPGGAVRSAEVTAPGFRSDLCSAFYPLAAASPVLGALNLGEFGLQWRHAPAVLAHLLPDGRAAVLHREPERTAESVERFAPGDGARWLAAYHDWLRVGEALLDAIFTPFPPVLAAVRLLRGAGAGRALRLARRMVVTADELRDEMFAGDGARLLLTGCTLHTDLTPRSAGAGVYGWLLTMVGQQYGFPVPVGGAQRLTDALVARLATRGGLVEYQAPVTRVVVRDGRALGVITADGTAHRARRAVLADVPAPVLYRELVGEAHLPARFVTDLARFRYDQPTLKVDWALSGPVPWAGDGAADRLGNAVAEAGTVHLGGDLHGLHRYAERLASGECPHRPFLLAGQMTTADPSRSPEGTESLWAYTHLPHSYAGLARDDDRIEAHTERMERVLEEHAPGFRSRILARHVQGPADLERENPGLPGGALGGGTSAAWQQLVFRPVPGLGRADTPIDRLYLAGASAHPGGGVHGGPGGNAARAALARHGLLTGELYRMTIGVAHRRIY